MGKVICHLYSFPSSNFFFLSQDRSYCHILGYFKPKCLNSKDDIQNADEICQKENKQSQDRNLDIHHCAHGNMPREHIAAATANDVPGQWA